VNRPDDRIALMVELGQFAGDVASELLGDHPIEGNYENLVSGDVESLRVNDTVDSAHQAKRLAGPRSSLDPNRRGI
jgi:hypothetical protein